MWVNTRLVFFQRTGLQRYTQQLGLSVFLLLFFCETPVRAGEPTPEIAVFVSAGCPHCEAARAFLLIKPFRLCKEKECSMLDDPTRLQLARLASTGSQEYSPGSLGCCGSGKRRSEQNERWPHDIDCSKSSG
jgi:hypothetical protein